MNSSITEQITQKLKSTLAPVHLEVINESPMHAVAPGSESHFKIIIASEKFNSLSLIEKHRKIYNILEDIMPSIHALTIRAFDLNEWDTQKDNIENSPACRGGSKADNL